MTYKYVVLRTSVTGLYYTKSSGGNPYGYTYSYEQASQSLAMFRADPMFRNDPLAIYRIADDATDGRWIRLAEPSETMCPT